MKNFSFTRRQFIAGTLGTTALMTVPGLQRTASAADPLKLATVFALSGPAALFGPTQTACAQLAVSQINEAGGIYGRPVEIIPLDGGAPPAEASKAVVRAMLRDGAELLVGSHDSSVREAIVATIKGKIPYVYTPLYEGGECAFNTYVTADTPQQQVRPSITYMAKNYGSRKFYLIGNDYVWPQKTNEQVKRYIAEVGGQVVGEEYVPLGAPNKFEDAVTRIKSAQPDLVVITLVGGDNVNFNRTFAGFGLDKSIKRISYLLEALTLNGIGPENSANLFSPMSYFASVDTPENNQFKASYAKKFGANAPPLSFLGVDAFSGIYCAKALIEKAKGTDANQLMAASGGLQYHSASGLATMTNRHVQKDMYFAECKGTHFEIVATFPNVAHGQTCS